MQSTMQVVSLLELEREAPRTTQIPRFPDTCLPHTFRSLLPMAVLLWLLIAAACLHSLQASSLFSFTGRALADIPNPNVDPLRCGRPDVPKSAVCDPDNKLTKDEKNEIEGYINKIPNAQVAVAIIEKMSMKSVATSDAKVAAERYARGLHDTWGVGSSETNDGVLVFMSIADRSVYISTGSGLQQRLTYDTVQSLILHMRPMLRKEKYGTALANCMIQMELLLSGQSSGILGAYGTSKGSGGSGSGSDESTTEIFLAGGLFLAFCGIAVLLQRRNAQRIRGYERGREVISKMMKAVDADAEHKADEQQNTYLASSCPICLEDFPKKDKDTPSEVQDTAVKADDPKAPMALRCGHVFCRGCLETYLRGAAEGCKCPICRAPVEDTMRPPADSLPRRAWRRMFSSSPASSAYRGYTATGTGTQTQTQTIDPADPSYGFHRHVPEYRFRLNRAHSLYPDLVTWEVLRMANSAIDRGSIHEFRSHLDTQQMEAQRQVERIREASRLQARNNGMSGSSYSFGGGRSGGGGGGGW